MGEKLLLIRGALYGLVGLIVLLFSLAVLGADNRSPQGPEIKPLERSVHPNRAQKPTQGEPGEATNPPPGVPSVLSSGGHREGQSEAEYGREHGPKGEGGLLGTPLNAEAVIAIFTILLFVATFALYLATRDLVRGADRTAERQLRAYVGVDNFQLSGDGESSPLKFNIIIKNFGKTPAFKAIIDIRLDVTLFGQNPEQRQIFSRTNQPAPIMPGGTYNATVPNNALQAQGLASAMESNVTIWIVGEIYYTDAFGKQRTTNLKFSIERGRGSFVLAQDGNEAT